MHLCTARLYIRPFRHDDALFVLRLLNEPSFIENIADRGIRNVADARRYVRETLTKHRAQGFGLCCVTLDDKQTSIGMVGLIKRDFLDDVDIGYALLPEFWAKGYAYEMSLAVLEYARATLQIAQLAAIVHPDNRASIGLLSKLGFAYERKLVYPPTGEMLLLYARIL